MKIRITGLPKYQIAGSVGDDDWIRKIMEYEASKGGYDPSKGAYGLSNWGYNSRNPTSIKEAINFYKEDFLPKVQQYPMGMRERAGDFMYNAGREPRVYMLDQYLRSIGKGELPNRSSYNIDINKNPNDWNKIKPQFETEWNKYSADIDKLPLEQRIDLLDKGRDFYYQNINRVNNQPNPAYDATWKGRVGMFGKYPISSNKETENSLKRTSFPLPEKIYANQFKSTKELPIVGGNTSKVPTVSSNITYKPPTDLSDAQLPDYVKEEEASDDGVGIPTIQLSDDDLKEQSATTVQPFKKRLNAYESNLKKSFNKVGDFSNRFISSVLPAVQYFDDKKKQKDYNRWFSQQKFNSSAVEPASMSGKHGNYAVTGSSYGKFRYPEMGFTNEARYFGNSGLRTFQIGGGVIDQELVLPFEFINVQKPTPESVVSQPVSSEPVAVSEGVNPMAQKTWDDVSKLFKGVSNAGIWGDKKHQTRKSDHNTGDALDISITTITQGNQVAQKLVNEAGDRGIKYLIFNRRIWTPKTGWQTYTPNKSNGNNPHTSHVHVSFNRGGQDEIAKFTNGGVIDEELSLPLDLISSIQTSPISEPAPVVADVSTTSSLNPSNWEHYNPGNIHIGDFAKSYGAKAGRKDAGGRVAIFPDITTGLKALKDLLFGPNYNTLTVEEARNKFVSGKTNIFNESTPHIVRAIGSNKKLSELTDDEKNKLVAEFIKWEDRNVYNKLQSENLLYMKDGGSITNNSNMRIRITGTPTSKMKYGGQSGYGFDLGQRNTYSAMSDNPYEKASNTLGPVAREDANIEAEEGETVYGDLDKDGHREHMVIGGKRHSEGGTPLNVPEGSFIYSDTKKMKIKDPQILKLFGMPASKSGYTPAEIAKKYNVNKYKAILQDPHADAVKKRTAELMIESAEKKLAYLALVQEAMKGFPQGIPEVAQDILRNPEQEQMSNATRVKAPLQPEAAEFNDIQEYPEGEEPQEEMMQAPEEEMMEQPPMMYGGEGYYDYGGSYIPEYGDYAYGGLVKYQTAGQVKKYKLKDKEVEAKKVQSVPSGYNPYTGIPNLYWKQGKTGSTSAGTWNKGKRIKITGRGSGTGPCANLTGTEEDMKKRPGCYKSFLETSNWKSASPEERAKAWKVWNTGGDRPTFTPGKTTTGTADDYVYIEDQSKDENLKWTCNPSGQGVISVDPNTPIAPNAVLYNSKEEAEASCGTEDIEIPPSKIPPSETPPPIQKPPKINNGRLPFFGSQFAVGPKKYHPYGDPLKQYIPDPTFLDPSLALANNAAIATTISRGYTGRPSQYGAMANAAQMNAINNAANLIGQYDNQNVGIANQFAPMQVDILNKTNQYEANRRDSLAYNENMYDKEYRNSLRSYLNNVDKFRKGNYEYYTKRNMLNATNPYYTIVDNPYAGSGNIMFKPGTTAYNAIVGPGASSTNPVYLQYQKDIDDLKGRYTEKQIESILQRKYGPVGRSTPGASNGDMQNWNQAYMNAMTSQPDDEEQT